MRRASLDCYVDADMSPVESDGGLSKPPPKRVKSKSKVWKKMSWFSKKPNSCRGEGPHQSNASADEEGATPSVDHMELDLSPSHTNSDLSASTYSPWSGSTSSSDGDFGEPHPQPHEMFRMKKSKSYPNSEIDVQSCLRPSIISAHLRHRNGTLKKGDQLAHDAGDLVFDDECANEEEYLSIPGRFSGQVEIMHNSETCKDLEFPHGCYGNADFLKDAKKSPIHFSYSASNLKCYLPKDNHHVSEGGRTAPLSSLPVIVPTRLKCSSESQADEASTCSSPDSPPAVFKSYSLPTRYRNGRTLDIKSMKPHLTSLAVAEQIASSSMPCVCDCVSRALPSPRRQLLEINSALPVGVEAAEFRNRLKVMRDWFDEFSDVQKNVLLREILGDCDLPQMHLLSLEMEPRLHEGCPPNCQDLITWLPSSISLYIMSYLDPESLCRASLVCKSWYQLSTEPCLWRRFCNMTKWRLSGAAEQKQILKHMLSSGNINWKQVLAERHRLRNNWLKGRCHVRTFEGHTQGISCVQFDDTRIVSGSSDKLIKVWNIRTNTPWSCQTLVGHSGTVRCLHLEGNRLVSGSTDRTIKVWDLSTQQSWSSIACKVTMVGHQDTVRCLQVDDDKVISGSYDRTLKVWDIRTGECRMSLRGHDAAVLCVQFDTNKIVSGSCDKTIKVWNFQGQCVMTLTGHHDAVTCLQFDHTRIISGSLDCTLKFWDINSGQCINTIDWKASEGHTGVVRCLQADSWRVVSASDDRTLKVWSLETGERLVTLRNHTDGVTCLQFNDSIIVSGSYDKTVKLWDFSCC